MVGFKPKASYKSRPMIVIATEIGDHHGQLVYAALKQLGFEATLWFGSDCPTQQWQSMTISQVDPPLLSVHSAIDLPWMSSTASTVWMRRFAPPSMPEFIKSEDFGWTLAVWRLFHEGLASCFHENSRWINLPAKEREANSKLLQLKTAKATGFHIPDTLISNNPSDVRDFLAKHRRKVVVKPLMMLERRLANRRVATRTSAIELADLNGKEDFTACPCIYQERISIRYEVRATVLGEKVVSARISRLVETEYVDWRTLERQQRKIEAYQLPPLVEQQCISLNRRLGLEFSCIDLIVDNEGFYHFLEVNPSGQFLWIELENHEIPMLKVFCEFLAGESIQRNVELHGFLSQSEVRDQIEKMELIHVKSNALNIVENMA